MEKGLRRLIQMSWVMRHSVILSNYTAMLHKTSQNYVSHSQATLVSSRRNKERQLERYARFSSNPRIILEENRERYKDMNGDEALEVLGALFKAIKENPCDSNQLTREKDFSNLCEAINRNIRSLGYLSLVEILKFLTFVNVPSKTLLLQTVLQLLTAHVNDISAVHIPFIDFLLRQQRTDIPLVAALMTALPLVFEKQVMTQIAEENLTTITSCLSYACNNSCRMKSIATICNALLNYQTIDLRNANYIYKMLSKLHSLPPPCVSLLSIAQTAIATNAKSLTHGQVMMLVKVITKEVPKGRTEFYSEELIEALCNVFLNFNADFTDGIRFLQMLNMLDYGYIPLLDYLAAKYYEQSFVLDSRPIEQITTLLKAFTISDYKPAFWDTIRGTLLNNPNIGHYLPHSSLLEFALNLIALDCYHPNVVKKAFEVDIELIAENRNEVFSNLLLLYQSIKTIYPEYEGPWPHKNVLQKIQSWDAFHENKSLRYGLEWAVGGCQYIRSDLRTKLGHLVDHVVVIQPGGQLAIINPENDMATDITFVEDLESPPGSRTILIFVFQETAYSKNYQRLKSTWQLKLRSAKKLTGYDIIAINLQLWENLEERERIPYLKQAVRLKSDSMWASKICQYV